MVYFCSLCAFAWAIPPHWKALSLCTSQLHILNLCHVAGLSLPFRMDLMLCWTLSIHLSAFTLHYRINESYMPSLPSSSSLPGCSTPVSLCLCLLPFPSVSLFSTTHHYTFHQPGPSSLTQSGCPMNIVIWYKALSAQVPNSKLWPNCDKPMEAACMASLQSGANKLEASSGYGWQNAWLMQRAYLA